MNDIGAEQGITSPEAIPDAKEFIKALVQNYGFRRIPNDDLPITFVYPSYAADGNDERFRFYPSLRIELAAGAPRVREDLKDKDTVITKNEEILREIGAISPRLEIEKPSAIYYNPSLVVGISDRDLSSYVVKAIVGGGRAWFELTDEEKAAVKDILQRKVNEKPFRSLTRRLFGR